MTRSAPLTIASLMLPLAVLAADSQSFEKSGYSLFNPVPGDQLRPLSSKAYDGVLDARTLDAGHFQVEGDFVNYYFNSESPYLYSRNEYSWAPRITAGLLNNVDFFVAPSYEVRTTYHDHIPSGFGRVTTGVKVNLWGNDSGTIALAVRPYLSISTSGGDLLGGGDVALLVRLPYGFYVKVNSEVYATESGGTFYAGFDNSMSINKSLSPKTEVYWYLNSTVTSNHDPNQQWYGYTGFGLSYNFTGNLQLFAGMGFGLTAPNWVYGQTRAYDYNPRFGFVWRF